MFSNLAFFFTSSTFSYFDFSKGESGQYDDSVFTDVSEAIKRFKKKFSDKTKNNWDKREDFEPVPGKYTMIEMSKLRFKIDGETKGFRCPFGGK